MSKIAENNQYYKGKQPITEEYFGKQRELLSKAASRNFCKIPGFLYEASIEIEEASKNKLSALNYTIVAEAIKRELQQTGHDYTQTYKESLITFELEKQELLTDLQQEFADLDATQSLSEEELSRLFIELDIRKLTLITTKTAIDIEMEGLKQEMVDIDRLTFTNEELLTSEKVATAALKLTVIPYLNDLIDAQERLLVAEEANFPFMESLLDEKTLLIEKILETIPGLEEKASALIDLATATLAAIEIEEDRLEVALSQAELKKDSVDNTLDIIDAEIAIEELRSLLYTAKHNLQLAKIDSQLSLTSSNTEDIGVISAARTAMMTNLEDYKATTAASLRSTRETTVSEEIEGDATATDTSVNADKSAISGIAAYRAKEARETSEISATAKITSKLIHLIGS